MFDTPPKETPTQVFSCDICVIFKKTFIYRTSSVAASVQRQLKKKKEKKLMRIMPISGYISYYV